MDPKLVIIVLASVMAPNGTMSSAGAVPTAELDTFYSKYTSSAIDD